MTSRKCKARVKRS